MKHPETYEQLREWFIERWDLLPDTLDGQFMYYPNVQQSAWCYMDKIDIELQTHGKATKLAKQTKTKLKWLYDALLDESMHNAPMATLESIITYKDIEGDSI